MNVFTAPSVTGTTLTLGMILGNFFSSYTKYVVSSNTPLVRLSNTSWWPIIQFNSDTVYLESVKGVIWSLKTVPTSDISHKSWATQSSHKRL